MDGDDELTPAQRRVVDELMVRDRARPRFDPGLGDSLRAQLEAALGPLAAELAEPIRVAKGALAQIHACEANYLAELDWQRWNTASAEGHITHRAIQLSIADVGHTSPLELVDYAIDELVADEASSLGGFL